MKWSKIGLTFLKLSAKQPRKHQNSYTSFQLNPPQKLSQNVEIGYVCKTNVPSVVVLGVVHISRQFYTLKKDFQREMSSENKSGSFVKEAA